MDRESPTHKKDIKMAGFNRGKKEEEWQRVH